MAVAQVDQIVTEFVQRGVGGLRTDLRAIGRDVLAVETRIARLNRTGLSIPFNGTAARTGIRGVTADLVAMETRVGRMGGGGGLLGRVLGGAAAGAGIGYIAKATGEMQMLDLSFTKLLGSGAAAKQQLAELKEFDRSSPFTFGESAKAAQRMLAVGFAAKDLKSNLTDIGDATSAAGGSTDDFMGIARAMGQMKSKGKVSMEEINQLADRGVPALQILQKQLRLTDEQLASLMKGDTTISADKAIPALLKGFRELYGGTMLEASKTLPGQISNLNSAVYQLAATVGGLEVSKAGTLLQTLTSMVDKANAFATANPGIAKFGLELAAVGLAAGFIIPKLMKYQNILVTTAAAKKALKAATVADTAAEAAKAVVAGREAKAIGGVGTAALGTAGDLATLGAGEGAKKLGLLARARGFAATPAFKLPELGRFGGTVSRGLLGGSLVAGGAAGMAVSGSGASTTQSIATAIGAATVAKFGGPWAAGAILIGSAIGIATNKLYSDKLEKAAVEGSTAPTGSYMERAAGYMKLRDELYARGDEQGARNAQQIALSLTKRGYKEGRDNARAAYEASRDVSLAEQQQRAAKINTGGYGEANTSKNALQVKQFGEVDTKRDGARTATFVVRMPEGPGDKNARTLRYNTLTASPSY